MAKTSMIEREKRRDLLNKKWNKKGRGCFRQVSTKIANIAIFEPNMPFLWVFPWTRPFAAKNLEKSKLK
jgi:hypothetical protein